MITCTALFIYKVNKTESAWISQPTRSLSEETVSQQPA